MLSLSLFLQVARHSLKPSEVIWFLSDKNKFMIWTWYWNVNAYLSNCFFLSICKTPKWLINYLGIQLISLSNTILSCLRFHLWSKMVGLWSHLLFNNDILDLTRPGLFTLNFYTEHILFSDLNMTLYKVVLVLTQPCSWLLCCYCKSPHVGSYFFHHSNSVPEQLCMLCT